jgi:hypothetical protein
MSNFKDKLKESQGSNSNFPKMQIVSVIEMKEDDLTKLPIFARYDKVAEVYVEVPAPIKGIYIGSAIQMSSYSDNLGSKGGNYKSDYYFDNKKITLFAPQAKGYEKVAQGTKEEVSAYIDKNSTSKAKVRAVMFIATEGGLVAVITNMTIAIDQTNKVKELLSEKVIILNPAKFFEADETISKKAKEYLGKFREKNPPKYAKVVVGEDITQELFDSLNADKHIEDFKKFKEFKTGSAEVKPTEIATVHEEAGFTAGNPSGVSDEELGEQLQF